MRLFEFQAKELFSSVGIPVPNSRLLESEADLERLSYPLVLKAQVLTGGRGKAGAIKVVDDLEAAKTVFKHLLGMQVKNEKVHAVLAEQKQAIKKEYYLSLLLDKGSAAPLIMASPEGGMDIEEVAKNSPEKLLKMHLDPLLGLNKFEIRKTAQFLGLSEAELGPILQALMRLYTEHDATLIEINPLAVTDAGLLALDGKMVVDDKAEFRNGDLFGRLKAFQEKVDQETMSPGQAMAKEWEITYLPLDGDLGLVSDGAGTGMLTLDLIRDAGGFAANFCELGGLANADRMEKSLKILATDPRIKVVMVSLIGGLTRMDHMAEGIQAFVAQNPERFKLAVRLCGTKAEEGKAILAGLGIQSGEDLVTEVAKAVEMAKEAAQ